MSHDFVIWKMYFSHCFLMAVGGGGLAKVPGEVTWQDQVTVAREAPLRAAGTACLSLAFRVITYIQSLSSLLWPNAWQEWLLGDFLGLMVLKAPASRWGRWGGQGQLPPQCWDHKAAAFHILVDQEVCNFRLEAEVGVILQSPPPVAHISQLGPMSHRCKNPIRQGFRLEIKHSNTWACGNMSNSDRDTPKREWEPQWSLLHQPLYRFCLLLLTPARPMLFPRWQQFLQQMYVYSLSVWGSP